MVQTRSDKSCIQARHALTKAQGIYNNTSNSLTSASASSADAVHYATSLPPSNPMPLARPRAHGTMKVGKVKIQSWCFQSPSEKCCIGQDEGHLPQAEGPQERNFTRSMCATTGTRQARPCARRQQQFFPPLVQALFCPLVS